jgi:hypothetical protein
MLKSNGKYAESNEQMKTFAALKPNDKELRNSMRIKLSCRVDGYKERFYNKQYQSIRKGLILELFFMMIYFILQVQEMRAIKYLDGITNRFRHLPIDV